MRVALLHTTNPSRRIALNKDLNGGLGTSDDYGSSLAGRLFSWLKWKLVSIPIISIAHTQAILKAQGHTVRYYEDKVPDEPFDLGFMYGSLVDFRNEDTTVARLKKAFPAARIGVFGPFPGRYPDRFPSCDFVVDGEIEALGLYGSIEALMTETGLVKQPTMLRMDDLPPPDYTGFPVSSYSYQPMLPKKPYLPLLASKGCPYSCGFYCSYGEYQQVKYRQRSAEKVYGDMKALRDAFRVRSVQFRDPIFGLNKRFVDEFCAIMKQRPLGIEWGMETRSDLLSPPLLDKMHAAGLRSINIGIETLDPKVAKINKRKLDEEQHQTTIIDYAKRIGIRINAFFIFGLEEDTVEGLENIARYALRLAPDAARFCVSTPYPGTGFYDKLDKEGRLIEPDWEKYSQFSLVYQHPNLTPEQVERHLVDAYVSFYLRPGYVWKTLLNRLVP